MNDGIEARGVGPSHRRVEIGTAIAMIAFGLVVVAGGLRVGIGWGAEGPRSGFFPFYLGLAIIASSAVNLAQAAMRYPAKLFAAWTELRQVLAVVVPTTVYVFVMPWTGLYLASIVLVTYFMVRLGRYSVVVSLALAVGVMAVTYLVFERWFLVPLPKGPIEELAGL